MLRTLNFAATEAERVNLVLDTGELIQGAKILNANELQVTFETSKTTSVISFGCIDAILVYQNTNTYDDVTGILEAVFSDNPVILEAYTEQFPLDIVFRSGYAMDVTISGEIQDNGADFAFVGAVNDDGNVAAVFRDSSVLRYNYNVAREGVPDDPVSSPTTPVAPSGVESILSSSLPPGTLALDDTSETIQNITTTSAAAVLTVTLSGVVGRKFTIICSSTSSRSIVVDPAGVNRTIAIGESASFSYDGTNWVLTAVSILTGGR